MGNIISPAGPYDHNPFVGNRPMKVPLTLSAEIAQFPVVYHWRYWIFAKPLVYAQIFINLPLFYYLQRKSFSPSNVEKWKKIRKEWYTRKLSPENDLF